MAYYDELGNQEDEYRQRGRRMIRQGRVFGQSNMDAPRQGRRRNGQTAGGFGGGWL